MSNSWNKPIGSYNAEPYGKELAKKVAEVMLKEAKEIGGSFVSIHRDYCGMGLKFDKNRYCFVYVNDGYPDLSPPHLVFKTQREFIDFLAVQSDKTMSGTDKNTKFFEKNDWVSGNQRINKAKLISGVNQSASKKKK